MNLHRCMDTQPPLKAAEIVVGDVLPDHPAQLLPVLPGILSGPKPYRIQSN